MLGPLGYIGQDLENRRRRKVAGAALSSLGGYILTGTKYVESFATAIARSDGVFGPAAHAADELANAIAKLGADIEGALKGLAGNAGKTWAIPATSGSHPRNSILHNNSYISPAISPKTHAALIHAEASPSAASDHPRPQGTTPHSLQCSIQSRGMTASGKCWSLSN